MGNRIFTQTSHKRSGVRTRVFIVHGWGGSPKSDWMVWAKDQLTQKGFEVAVPEMPDTADPKIDSWVKKLTEVVGEVRESDVFIGHSIGCQAILRYLENLQNPPAGGTKVKKVILVAGWDKYLTLDEGEGEETAAPWKNTPINYEKIKDMSEFIAVFSTDDPWVPYKESVKIYKMRLGAEIVTKEKMGHFNQSQIPFLLKLI